MNPTPAEAVSIGFEQRVATLLCAEQGLTAHRANTLAFVIAGYATESAATQPAGEIGEIITYGTGFQEVRWVAGDMPPSGTKLYTAAPAATSVTSAPIEAGELPPLPQPMRKVYDLPHGSCELTYYTSHMMREYGKACVLADRASRGKASDAEYPAVQLTRDHNEMCEVKIRIAGEWVSVLRDNGTIIDHTVGTSAVKRQVIAARAQQQQGGAE